MKYKLEEVKIEEKDILFNLLQFALYDGSQYIENNINNDGLFNYKWFDSYFTDDNRVSYFIRTIDNELIGFVMINQYLKIFESGNSIAEFLILPQYRRKHIGKRVMFDIFNIYKGNWEVEPIENSKEAYEFWKNTIKNYTNDKYSFKDNIFLFNNKEI